MKHEMRVPDKSHNDVITWILNINENNNNEKKILNLGKQKIEMNKENLILGMKNSTKS